MDQSASSPFTGALLLLVSASFIRCSVYIFLSEDDCGGGDNGDGGAVVGSECADNDYCEAHEEVRQSATQGFPLSILTPLSVIPLLIFLMIRYVSLRLYLRN